MFEAKSLSFSIRSKPLLEKVSLKITPGQVTAVVGPNGAGKSTLLKLLCGDLSPSNGEVWLNNRPLKQWSALEQAQRRAVLPQHSALSFPFTALEVVLMGRMPHCQGLEGQADYDIARLALAKTESLHLQNRLYPTLSGGEQQRVQLARVLAQIWETSTKAQRYLLLDEPTNNLDLAHQHRTLQLTKSLTQEGIGILTILHDLNLAAQYADQVLVLKAGQAVAVGPPAQIFTPQLVFDVFDLTVFVLPHPLYQGPLIVPTSTNVLSSEKEYCHANAV